MKIDINTDVRTGGRCLDAVMESETLSSIEKLLMLVLGSKANFTGHFTEFNYHSLDKLVKLTSLSQRTICRITKELETKGYIIRQKRYADNGTPLPTNYALTMKIFKEYALFLEGGTDTQSGGVLTHSQEGTDTQSGGVLTQWQTSSSIPISSKNFLQDKSMCPTPASPPGLPISPSSPLALEWKEFALEKSPHLKPKVEEWSKELERIKAYLKRDKDYVMEVFTFIKDDEFWQHQCISPMGLMKKGKNGLRKIDNVIASMTKSIKPKGRYGHHVADVQEFDTFPEITDEQFARLKHEISK